MKINTIYIASLCLIALVLPQNHFAQNHPWTVTLKHGNNQAAEIEAINHIQFVDNQHGWSVGEKGIIKATVDGGQHWKNLMSPTSKSLLKSFFLNNQTGWVFGIQGVLFHTTDGGKTWKDLSIVGSMAIVRDLYFIDQITGWMIHENQVYLSKDGGKTWSDLDLPLSTNELRFSQIAFHDKKMGWLVHSGGLFQTVDGGNTWQEYKNLDLSKYNNGYISTINLLNGDNIALVLNQPDYMLFSEDRGKTWKQKKCPMENSEYGDAIFSFSIKSLSDNSLLFYGSEGWSDSKIFRSVNKGETWDEILLPYRDAVKSLHFLNNKTGIIVGHQGILKTTDGGQTWIDKSEKPLPSINKVHFSSSNTGFAVGNESTVLFTNNKGDTWEKISVPEPNLELTNLTLLTKTHSWITGSMGSLLSMQNDNKTWIHTSFSEEIQFDSEVHREMLKNTFPDGKNHFVIQKLLNFNLNELWMYAREPQGMSVSHIFRSIDGGKNWAKVPTEQEYSFVDFHMSDRVQFYAIDRKNLYISNDQCLSWNKIPLPKSTWFNLRKIVHVQNFGLVIQTDRSLLFYSPSQNTINEKPFKGNIRLKEVYFRNAELGWGISDKEVFETLDGGDTWAPLSGVEAFQARLLSFTVFDNNTIWLNGENGFIALLYREIPETNPADDLKEEMKNRLNNFINRERN